MKNLFLILVSFVLVAVFSSCNKEDEVHFILQIDSVSNISKDSAIAYITDLTFEKYSELEYNWHPMLFVNTNPDVSLDLPTTGTVFSTTEEHQKNYVIQLYNLSPNTTYYAVVTDGLDKSEEISFKTLSE